MVLAWWLCCSVRLWDSNTQRKWLKHKFRLDQGQKIYQNLFALTTGHKGWKETVHCVSTSRNASRDQKKPTEIQAKQLHKAEGGEMQREMKHFGHETLRNAQLWRKKLQVMRGTGTWGAQRDGEEGGRKRGEKNGIFFMSRRKGVELDRKKWCESKKNSRKDGIEMKTSGAGTKTLLARNIFIWPKKSLFLTSLH